MTRDTETLFWDFEDEDDFEGWLSLDNDGDGYGWEVDDYYSHNSGSYSLKSRSYYAGALDPDNWLISPEVPLGGTLSFFSMNYLTSYPDNFAVYVCVGTPTSAEDFVQVSGMITPPTTWTEYTVDLSDFAGEVGCFAIRHYNSYDMYQVYIDDITYTLFNTADLKLLGYNIYWADELLNDEPITTTTYETIWLGSGDYRVTAVYEQGESALSEPFRIVTTGIENVTPDSSSMGEERIYDLSGRRIPNTSKLPKGVFIRNGKRIVVK